MPSDVTRDEFQRLQGRVDTLEGEVEGEKSVTRHILEQTRRNGDDLAALAAHMGGELAALATHMGGELTALKTRMDKVEGRLGRVETELHKLRDNMPVIVADTMRDVLRERGGD